MEDNIELTEYYKWYEKFLQNPYLAGALFLKYEHSR